MRHYQSTSLKLNFTVNVTVFNFQGVARILFEEELKSFREDIHANIDHSFENSEAFRDDSTYKKPNEVAQGCSLNHFDMSSLSPLQDKVINELFALTDTRKSLTNTGNSSEGTVGASAIECVLAVVLLVFFLLISLLNVVQQGYISKSEKISLMHSHAKYCSLHGRRSYLMRGIIRSLFVG